MALPVWIWLPSGSTQIGELPFRVRLVGLMTVIPGPLSLAYWDLRYNRLTDALPWVFILIGDVVGLAYGLHSPDKRVARFIGYVAVVIWVLMGFMFSIAGL